MTNLQRLLNFAKDTANNYDQEGRDECYSSCRVCRAEAVIREVLGDKADSLLHGPYYTDDAAHIKWMADRGSPVDHLEVS